MRQIILNFQLFVLLFLGGSIMGCYAQGFSSNSSFWEHVRYGGAVGLGFGNNSVNIIAAPSAVYQFNEQWAIGTGLSFNYAKFGDQKFTAYGAGLMTYFNPIRALQLSAEFQQLRVNRDFGPAFPEATENYWLPSLFMGIGYTTGPVTFGIRYDILYDVNKSIYADPWMPFIRVFF